MVDFLARLAERTLRTMPVAQPILAARFAPGQVMTTPILETETWSSARAAPVQDAAIAQRAVTGAIPLMQGKQTGNMSATNAATINLMEASSMVGDRVGTNEVGMMQTEEDVAAASATTTNLVKAKSAMRAGDLALDKHSSEVHVPGADKAAGSPVWGTGIGTINRPPGFVGEGENSNEGATPVVGSPKLPDLLIENPTFAEEPHKRNVELSPPSSVSGVMNSLPPAQGSLHTAFAPGITLRQGQPVALEQGEALLPIISIPADPLIEMQSDSALSGEGEQRDEQWAVKEEGDIVPRTAVGAGQGDHKGSLLLYHEVTSEKYRAGTELAPVSRNQGHVSPTGNQKVLPSHSQPPSHLRTVGQEETLLLEEYVEAVQLGSPSNIVPEEHAIGPNTTQRYDASTNKKGDLLTVEQHLLVSQGPLPQEITPQEQASRPLTNVFTPGSVRNRSLVPLAQHDSVNLQSGSSTALAAEATPIPPSIHITIGRIDVRAVTSPGPTPPPKPARPSPLLSLDDYLKQGKGGGQ